MSDVDERTLARKVYAAIRPKILQGDVGPGARLSLREVSQEHGVSLSVVREAMTRLASEELVEAIPQHGFRVREASIPDLLDLTWVRIEIKSLAIRESVSKGDLDWECALISAHHKLASTKIRVNGKWNPQWTTAHSDFHAALVSACPSPILLRIRQQLYDASEIYRSWGALAPNWEARDTAGEHSGILNAALAREADLAVNLLTRHLQETTGRISKWKEAPVEFERARKRRVSAKPK